MTFDPIALTVPGVQSLKPYQPGKGIAELERELGVSNIVKLASNENPRTVGSPVWDAIKEILPDLSRYPDGGGYRLKQALAEQLGVQPNQITLGNGSNDVLEMLARAFVQARQKVVVSEHSFAVYSLVAKAIDSELHVTPAVNWGHDLNGMRQAIDSNTRLVFIANPNNPTGTWVSKQELEAFLNSIPNHVLIVLDEAYFEYVEEEDYPNGVPLLRTYPNLVVTRTFSKIYGLAGMRIGYSISSQEIAEILNRIRQPFNVNVVGYAAAIVGLKHQEFVDESRQLNQEEMNRIYKTLEKLHLNWIPSVANFIAIELEQKAELIVQHMLKNGVIVRSVDNYGMPNHIRMTIGLEEENNRALQALQTALTECSG